MNNDKPLAFLWFNGGKWRVNRVLGIVTFQLHTLTCKPVFSVYVPVPRGPGTSSPHAFRKCCTHVPQPFGNMIHPDQVASFLGNDISVSLPGPCDWVCLVTALECCSCHLVSVTYELHIETRVHAFPLHDALEQELCFTFTWLFNIWYFERITSVLNACRFSFHGVFNSSKPTWTEYEADSRSLLVNQTIFLF